MQNNIWPKSMLRANFRVIEEDLFNYKLMKKKVEEVIAEYNETDFEPGPKAVIINDIYSVKSEKQKPLQEGHEPEYIKAHSIVRNVSNPTYDQAIKSMTSSKRHQKASRMYTAIGFTELIRRVEAIEEVLNRLETSSIGYDRQKAELVKERYFERQLTPDGLALKYCISRATVYRWSEDVVKEIATKLGFIV